MYKLRQAVIGAQLESAGDIEQMSMATNHPALHSGSAMVRQSMLSHAVVLAQKLQRHSKALSLTMWLEYYGSAVVHVQEGLQHCRPCLELISRERLQHH